MRVLEKEKKAHNFGSNIYIYKSMRTVHFILRNLFVVCGLLLSFNLSAQSNKVDSIDIHVLLYPDGSASIHENWHIQIRENITEWYLVQGNLGEIEITDFSVSDETGKKFILEEEWDLSLIHI